MAFPAIAAAGISQGGSDFGRLQGQVYSMRNASQAWDKYKDSLTRGPTYARQGWEDAGFNPLLALGGKFSGNTIQGAQPGGGPGPSGDLAKVDALADLAEQQTATSGKVAEREDAQRKHLDSLRVKAESETAIIEARRVAEEAQAEFFSTEAGRAALQAAAANKALKDAAPSIGSVLGAGAAGVAADLMKSAEPGGKSKIREKLDSMKPKNVFERNRELHKKTLKRKDK